MALRSTLNNDKICLFIFLILSFLFRSASSPLSGEAYYNIDASFLDTMHIYIYIKDIFHCLKKGALLGSCSNNNNKIENGEEE